MSHIVTIRTKVRDPAAVAAACTRMGLAAPTAGRVELYAGQAEGLVIRLPGWTYPAVVDLATGRGRAPPGGRGRPAGRGGGAGGGGAGRGGVAGGPAGGGGGAGGALGLL